MSLWLLQPDGQGNCCDCQGRNTPCDSCSYCGITEAADSIEEAQALIQAFKTQWFSCLYPAETSSFTCISPNICRLDQNCGDEGPIIITRWPISSVSPSRVLVSDSISSSANCYSSTSVVFELFFIVPAGTTLTLNYTFGGSAAGGDPGFNSFGFSFGVSILNNESPQTIFQDQGSSGGGQFIYTFSSSACILIAGGASAQAGIGAGTPGSVSCSSSANVDISFNQNISVLPMRVLINNTNPPQYVTCS